MPNFRLEIWFDFDKDKCEWGVAQASANSNDTTPFQSGGSEIGKNNDKTKVAVPGSANQGFDIYLFDMSNQDQQRKLQWFAIDYEQAATPAPGQSGRDPVPSADTLRTGVTGDVFMGAVPISQGSSQTVGGSNGVNWGVGQENNVVCDHNNAAKRRWSLNQGYGQSLTAGNYAFTIGFVIGSPTEGKVKAFSVDPEMDIQN
jgi:hypothetical protein